MTAVFKHELRMYFRSLTAYVFGAFLLAFTGIGAMLYNIQAAVSNFEFVLSFCSLVFVGDFAHQFFSKSSFIFFIEDYFCVRRQIFNRCIRKQCDLFVSILCAKNLKRFLESLFDCFPFILQHQVSADQSRLGFHTFCDDRSLFLSLCLRVLHDFVRLCLIIAYDLLCFLLCFSNLLLSAELCIISDFLYNAFNIVQPVSPRFQSFPEGIKRCCQR